MIKKLKIKFILTTMISITIVMVSAFTILYISTAKVLEQSSVDAMHDIALSDHGGAEGIFQHGGGKKPNSKSYISTYTIDLHTRNNTCYVDGFGDVENLSDEQVEYINSLIHIVGNQKSPEGVLDEYDLRYFCTETVFGLRIVLLDKRYEDDNLNQLLLSLLTVGIVAFAAFLIISIIVAGIAVKPVEKSMKQQKQLVADISHELKTPIAVISTNTDIILSHEDSKVSDENKWLGYIKDETGRMTELLNMMLYLAKTDEENGKPVLDELDLSNLTYEMALPFESVCFENQKEFVIDIQPDVIINGEAGSIKQLIAILLDNAVKYSNENGKIKLSLYINGDKAVISVFNTGEPIPKESIPLIFDRFYRVDKARSREKGGSGLGLSIAKRVIENNEGTISVSSDAENGTVFNCTFNIVKKKKEKGNNQFT